MKKFLTFFIIIVAIFSSFCYIYNQKKIELNEKNVINAYYERLHNKEISANELISVINKAYNNNEHTNYVKNDSGEYIDNTDNAIIIKVKFKLLEDDMEGEKIYRSGSENFNKAYRDATFKCNRLEYNRHTKLVKFLHFEEV